VAKQIHRSQQKDVELSARRSGVFDRSRSDLGHVKALEGQAETLRETVEHHRRQAQAAQRLFARYAHGVATPVADEYTEPVRRELAPLLRALIDGADLSLNETLGGARLCLREGRDE